MRWRVALLLTTGIADVLWPPLTKRDRDEIARLALRGLGLK